MRRRERKPGPMPAHLATFTPERWTEPDDLTDELGYPARGRWAAAQFEWMVEQGLAVDVVAELRERRRIRREAAALLQQVRGDQ